MKIEELSQIEIVSRIDALLNGLPMFIQGEVGIVHSGNEAPYIHAKIEEWKEASDEANKEFSSYIDSTFWDEDFIITQDMENNRVVETLEAIETKVNAYAEYCHEKIDKADKDNEERLGEYATWVAFNTAKTEVVAVGEDFYNSFADEYQKGDVIILKAPKNEVKLPF